MSKGRTRVWENPALRAISYQLYLQVHAKKRNQKVVVMGKGPCSLTLSKKVCPSLTQMCSLSLKLRSHSLTPQMWNKLGLCGKCDGLRSRNFLCDGFCFLYENDTPISCAFRTEGCERERVGRGVSCRHILAWGTK